jgi:hypothetical protein
MVPLVTPCAPSPAAKRNENNTEKTAIDERFLFIRWTPVGTNWKGLLTPLVTSDDADAGLESAGRVGLPGYETLQGDAIAAAGFRSGQSYARVHVPASNFFALAKPRIGRTDPAVL